MSHQATSHPSLIQKLGAGIVFTILTVGGLVVNLLTIYAILKNRKFFFRYSFYFLACHLIVASIGVLIGQLVVTIPLTLSGSPLYGDSALLIILASGDTLFFLTIFFISFLISLNRFCALFSIRLHNLLFEGRTLYFVSVIPWFLGVVWVVTTTLIGCPKVFRHDAFYYTYRCKESLSQFGHVFMKVSMHIGYLVPPIMLIFYLLAILYTRKRTNKLQSGYETRILWQAMLTCSCFEAESVLFTFLPKLTDDLGVFAISVLLGIVLIVNSTLNALIVMMYTTRVKTTVRNIFCTPQPPATVTDIRVFEVSTIHPVTTIQ